MSTGTTAASAAPMQATTGGRTPLRVLLVLSNLEFGGAQLVMCTPEGYAGASDPRRDGCAVGF